MSLFPALLLLVTSAGYILAGDPDLQRRLIESAVGQFPFLGTQLAQNISALQGSPVAVVIGCLGLLYGALGIGQGTQLAFNRAWAVPRGERPDVLRSRVRSLLFVLLIGAGLVLTTVLTGLGAAIGGLHSGIGVVARLLVLAAAILANVALFAVVFRLLTARDVPARDLLPGAVLAAFGWDVLQALGTTYVSRVVARSTDIYGVFGVVLGLLAWIYFGAVIIVLAAELNVVRACRLWPRSLLAPFTDGLPLTPADRQAYASYARMRRYKSFEKIDVSFDEPER